MDHPTPPRMLQHIAYQWLLLTVIAVGMAVSWLWADRQDTLRQAAVQQTNVARLLEIHTTHVIGNANTVLDRVIDEVRDHDIMATGADKRWPVLARMAERLPSSGRLWLYRADGTAVMASHLRRSNNNATDREYFTAQRERDAGLFIGETVVGKTTHKKVFNLSRRLETPDGTFAGVAMAAIDIDVFVQAVSELKLGNSAAYTLARLDGAVIMRHPDEEAAGKRFGLRVLNEITKAPYGVYSAVSLLDGVDRQLAYRKHPTLPVVIVVSLAREEILASWVQRAWVTAVALCCLLGLGSWLTLKSHVAARREARVVAHMQTVLDTVAEGICGIDAHGNVAFINPAGAALLGCDPDELVGHPLRSVAGWSDENKPAPEFASCQASGTTTVQALGGLRFTAEYSATQVSDLGGRPGLVVAFRDVSPLIASRNALQEQKEFVTRILDSLAEQVAVVDGKGVITQVNEAWRLFAHVNGAGGAPAVSVGSNYLHVCSQAATGGVHADQAGAAFNGIQAVLDGTKDHFTLEYPCDAPDEKRWFAMTVLPLKGAQGGAVIIHQNLTERHVAEEKLRTGEEHFRMLAENMADMVWKADQDLRFTYINDADRRVRGFERGEVIGHTIMDTLTPEGTHVLASLKRQRQALESSGRKGVPLRVEFPQRCKDGGEVWTEVTTMPIYDLNGHINGYQGIGRDVTARKQQERTQQDERQELESQLAQAETEKAELHAKANRDPLTGLNNRRYLNDALPHELTRAQRKDYPVAVIMVDLDHFKVVNDTHGHAAGDEVLRTLAALLKRCARESDLICRYGGEEFVIVMPGMSTQGAWERVDTLRKILADTSVQHGDATIRVTMSAGIAAFPEHSTHEATLLTQADHALYQAKRRGRNQVAVYNAADTADNRSDSGR